MARILFTLQPGVGHLTPLVPLATALHKAGHEVRIGTSRSFGGVVEAYGLAAVPLGLDWLESRAEATFPGFLESAGDAQARIMAGAPAPALAADVVALAQIWRPDVLIRDCWEFGGWAAAEEIGIPSVVYGVSARLPPPRLVAQFGAQLAALRAVRHLPADPTLSTIEGGLFLDTTPPLLEFIPRAPSETRVVRIRPVYDDTRGPQQLPSWFSKSDDQIDGLGNPRHRQQP